MEDKAWRFLDESGGGAPGTAGGPGQLLWTGGHKAPGRQVEPAWLMYPWRGRRGVPKPGGICHRCSETRPTKRKDPSRKGNVIIITARAQWGGGVDGHIRSGECRVHASVIQLHGPGAEPRVVGRTAPGGQPFSSWTDAAVDRVTRGSEEAAVVSSQPPFRPCPLLLAPMRLPSPAAHAVQSGLWLTCQGGPEVRRRCGPRCLAPSRCWSQGGPTHWAGDDSRERGYSSGFLDTKLVHDQGAFSLGEMRDVSLH